MAKSSKKSDATESKSANKSAGTETKKSDAKAHAAKSPAAKASRPTAGKSTMQSSTPLIDTSLAASSAARMLAAGLNAKNTKPTGPSGKPESSLFKQMKSGLNKPHSAAMDSLLDKTHGPGTQKTQGFQKQVAHNQTIGSDATRKSVPRRTAG